MTELKLESFVLLKMKSKSTIPNWLAVILMTAAMMAIIGVSYFVASKPFNKFTQLLAYSSRLMNGETRN